MYNVLSLNIVIYPILSYDQFIIGIYRYYTVYANCTLFKIGKKENIYINEFICNAGKQAIFIGIIKLSKKSMLFKLIFTSIKLSLSSCLALSCDFLSIAYFFNLERKVLIERNSNWTRNFFIVKYVKSKFFYNI